jgi:two-component system KDP operon response regulator KdpE
VRRCDHRVPLTVVSAVDDDDQKLRALDCGADDYITKPSGPLELVARLRAALRGPSAATSSRGSSSTVSRSICRGARYAVTARR